MILKESDTLETAAKNITTSLLNVFLTLGSEGIKALTEHEKGASLDTLQIAISAPWSYTVTKTVSCIQDEPFTITKDIVDDLIASAKKQALETIDEDDLMHILGLEVITEATINISANNYNTPKPYGAEVTSIQISHTSAISQKHLLDAIREAKEKVLPKTSLEILSFMLIYYSIVKKLAPNTSEICLVDVTSEATEIGIVRDGILRYVTHAPFGINTIARDISALCKIPLKEALGYIRGEINLEKTLKSTVQEELAFILTTYEEKLAELFSRTGDTLAIPRPLFIHTDSRTEKFFSEHLKNAAHFVTKGEHGIHLVTQKLLNDTVIDDTALLLSAHFFHKQDECIRFIKK